MLNCAVLRISVGVHVRACVYTHGQVSQPGPGLVCWWPVSQSIEVWVHPAFSAASLGLQCPLCDCDRESLYLAPCLESMGQVPQGPVTD